MPEPHHLPVDPDVDLHEPGQRAELRAHPWVVLTVIAAGLLIGALMVLGTDLWPHRPLVRRSSESVCSAVSPRSPRTSPRSGSC